MPACRLFACLLCLLVGHGSTRNKHLRVEFEWDQGAEPSQVGRRYMSHLERAHRPSRWVEVDGRDQSDPHGGWRRRGLFRVTGKTGVAIAVQGSGLLPYAFGPVVTMFEIKPLEALSNGARFQAMAQALVANFEVRWFEAVSGAHQPPPKLGHLFVLPRRRYGIIAL